VGTHTWTKARKKAVAAWVEAALPPLGLAGWRVELDFDTAVVANPDEEVVADICHAANSRHAYLRFGPQFLAQSAADATQALTHELMHAHLFALQDTTAELLVLLTTPDRASVANVALLAQVERSVDALADAFQPLLPFLDLHA